mmetsp:Transcript_31664/g.76662  ORF Transcript_31664/g.76662 Transcript_31664/m.76662 type:complete len:310 (+) Transcript_31664:1801-2730(+)
MGARQQGIRQQFSSFVGRRRRYRPIIVQNGHHTQNHHGKGHGQNDGSQGGKLKGRQGSLGGGFLDEIFHAPTTFQQDFGFPNQRVLIPGTGHGFSPPINVSGLIGLGLELFGLVAKEFASEFLMTTLAITASSSVNFQLLHFFVQGQFVTTYLVVFVVVVRALVFSVSIWIINFHKQIVQIFNNFVDLFFVGIVLVQLDQNVFLVSDSVWIIICLGIILLTIFHGEWFVPWILDEIHHFHHVWIFDWIIQQVCLVSYCFGWLDISGMTHCQYGFHSSLTLFQQGSVHVHSGNFHFLLFLARGFGSFHNL